MKNKRAFLVLGALFFIGMLLYVGNPGADGNGVRAATQEEAGRTITVSGTGEVQIKPDVAYVRLGVQTEEKSAEAAQQANARAFEKIREVLDQHQISENDIETVRFDLWPRYDYMEQKRVLRGYTLNHIIEITYRDMDGIGGLLDDLSRAGVNRVDQIRFDTEKQSKYEIEALEKAIASARQKAEAMVKAEGKQVSGVVQMVEEGSSVQPVRYDMVTVAKESASAETDVYSGEVTVRKSVRVVYEF
ncbi:MAG: SIMPL domain-containing protein [Bacillaceae bacterium]|nr:SIMPL domain-containing protein [Bacillaceae bacterium]